jgi:CSLREA domain-containing protein
MKSARHSIIRYAPFAALLVFAVTAGCGPSSSPLPCSTLTITVTKTADTNDGVCSAADCSLREAVIMSNTCVGTQSIEIPAGTYTLTIPGIGEGASATGDLNLTDDASLTGIGDPVIDGNHLDRVFQVTYPTKVKMAGLVIQNGQNKDGAGILNDGSLSLTQVVVRGNAAVTPSGSSNPSRGGGILSQKYGVLFIQDSTISGNRADQGGGIKVIAIANLDDPSWSGPGFSIRDSLVSENIADDFGGGMALESTIIPFSMEILRTQVADNQSGNYGSGIYNDAIIGVYQSVIRGNHGALEGGGVYSTPLGNFGANEDLFEANEARNNGGGIFTRGQAGIYHSAFIGNKADQGMGAAIYNDGTDAEMILSNSTLSGNRALTGGAGLANAGGDARINFSTITLNDPEGLHHTGGGGISVETSILSDNVNGNCGAAPPTSIGHNIDSGDTCALLGPGDLPDTDPLLQPLAMNGGLTPTHALDAASPAIDTGVSANWCFLTDQRGVARPQGKDCDRGAYERELRGGGSAMISGKVWHDLCAVPDGPIPATPPPGCSPVSPYNTANGILEPGEPGIPGVTLHLKAGTCAAGADLATAVTDAAGLYSFSGLAAGTYCISINPIADGNDAVLIPGGWTYPSAGSAVVQTEITLAAGEIHPDVNFGWDYQFLPMMPDYLTPTPTPAALSFINPRISTEHVYYSPSFSNRHCGPTEVEFRVGLSSLKGVANVLLFVRLKEQSSGLLGEWADGIPMSSTGDGQFLATVYAENIPGAQTFGESWVQYQFVALNAGGEAIVHSEVFWNLAFSPCR